MSDVKDFLQELKALNDNQLIDIFIPSLQRSVKFRPFSAKQQKDIIKTVLSGIEGNIKLTSVFNDIIIENCTETGVTFYLFDRNKIIVEMRKFSFGNNIKLDTQLYDLTELPEYTAFDKLDDVIVYNNIEVSVRIPTIDVDSAVTLRSLHEFYKLDTEEQKLTNSVNILVVYELIKFISHVKIGDQEVSFDKLSIADRKDIVDNLPLALNNKILDFITQYKLYEQSLLSFNGNVSIPIDASFLSSE